MNKCIMIIIVFFLFVSIGFTGCVKVVKIGQETELTGESTFNAGESISEIWETQITPELSQKAVELNFLLREANGDLKGLADKYGKYSTDTSDEICYVVQGTAVVNEVNQEKKTGFLKITLDDYSGSEVIKIQIGPVYKGSAIRDSLDCLKYEDYKNQVEWAAVSQSIHDKIQTDVIGPLDVESLPGKTIDFLGCFSVSNNDDEILITPVQLMVE